MTRFLTILPVCGALLCLAQDGITKKEFRRLHFLAGTWQLQSEGGTVFEQWRPMRDGSLAGRGFKVAGGDTVVTETIRLIWRDNAVYYIPTVATQNDGRPVEFVLTGVKDSRYIFENPEHDFPQRIIYKLISTTDLEVVLDAPYAQSTVSSQTWVFKRK